MLPLGTVAMVLPEAMIACFTRTSKETFQFEGNVGLVVDVTVRITVDFPAYQIIGECSLLLPDRHGNSVLDIVENILIL
jgi:hypothetical protein